jgi:CHASE3 domain sensor protein
MDNDILIKANNLKSKLTDINNQLLKAEGKQEEILKQIKNEFDCDSIEALQNLINDLNNQTIEYETNLNQYIKESQDIINKFSDVVK